MTKAGKGPVEANLDAQTDRVIDILARWMAEDKAKAGEAFNDEVKAGYADEAKAREADTAIYKAGFAAGKAGAGAATDSCLLDDLNETLISDARRVGYAAGYDKGIADAPLDRAYERGYTDATENAANREDKALDVALDGVCGTDQVCSVSERIWDWCRMAIEDEAPEGRELEALEALKSAAWVAYRTIRPNDTKPAKAAYDAKVWAQGCGYGE